MEMTRAKLDGYRKLVQEIPILECELRELRLTDKGMGNSVIINGKNGSKKPESVVGFDHERYNRRKESLQRKKEEARAIREWIEAIEDKMCVPDVLRGWDDLGADCKQDRTQQKPGLSAADDKGCIPEKKEDKIKKVRFIRIIRFIIQWKPKAELPLLNNQILFLSENAL